MDDNMERGLVMRALQMVLLARKPEKGLLHHSERGSQVNQIRFKQELVYHRQYQNRKEAKGDIFEYIQVWYNRKRKHSALGYQSPEQYENKGQYQMAA
jgi:putative transposase